MGWALSTSRAQWLIFHSSRLPTRQVDFIESLGLDLEAILAVASLSPIRLFLLGQRGLSSKEETKQTARGHV